MSDAFTAQIVVLEPDGSSVQCVRQALRLLHLDPQARYWMQREVEPMANRLPADLVILGLSPKQDDNLTCFARVHQAYPHAVVMGLGYPIRSEDRCALFDAGLDSLLEKPFSEAECASTIRALLRRQDMRRTM